MKAYGKILDIRFIWEISEYTKKNGDNEIGIDYWNFCKKIAPFFLSN